MKLRQKFAIIVAVTMVQVLLLVVLILKSSSKMQEMKNYQYVQATIEVDLGDTINLLNQVDYWGFDKSTVADDFKTNVEALGKNYAFISTNKILKSFPESFVHSLSDQIILWNAFSTKFSTISIALQKIQNMKISPDVAAYVSSEGIRSAAAQFPDDKSAQDLLEASSKIHKQMEGILRSGKRLAKLNAECAVSISEIIVVAEQQAKLFSLIMAAIACIIMGFLILIATNGIAKRIAKIRDKTSILASKDFTTKLKPEGSSEMRSLMENINNMVNQINNFFNVVKDSASKAIASGYSINNSVTSTATATSQIDNNIDEINKEFEEITKSIQLTIEAISDMNDHVAVLVENNEKQTSSIEESNSAVNGAVTTLEYINQMAMQRTKSAEEMHLLVADGDSKINQTSKVLNDITSQLGKVREIVTIINKVSSKTNLLSMNAGIEAVHAGEAGKGFGVVAGEIRALAEETSKNAVLIEGVVKNIVDSVSEANSSSAAASTAFIKVRDNADEIIRSLQEITNGVGSIDSQMHQIKDKSEETACAADEINTYCTNLALRQKEVSSQVDSMNELFIRTKSSILQIKEETVDIVQRIDEVRGSSDNSYKNMTDLENILEEFKTKSAEEIQLEMDEANAGVEKSDAEVTADGDVKEDAEITTEAQITTAAETENDADFIADVASDIPDIQDLEELDENELEDTEENTVNEEISYEEFVNGSEDKSDAEDISENNIPKEQKSFNGGEDEDFFINSAIDPGYKQIELEDDDSDLYPDDLEALVEKNNNED